MFVDEVSRTPYGECPSHTPTSLLHLSSSRGRGVLWLYYQQVNTIAIVLNSVDDNLVMSFLARLHLSAE